MAKLDKEDQAWLADVIGVVIREDYMGAANAILDTKIGDAIVAHRELIGQIAERMVREALDRELERGIHIEVSATLSKTEA